jgi:nucleoside-diphosphate-sugar epimerase
VQGIGRAVAEDLQADVIWHLAAPNHRDEQDCRDFMRFNELVAATGVPVINTGTWWQYAGDEAAQLQYTNIKQAQQEMFATTLVLFSVYGQTTRQARGYIPQLIEHANGGKQLLGASRQQRDWVHVEDICQAFLAASAAPPGVYDIGTGTTFSPHELALALTGCPLPDYVEFPNCAPRYVNQPLPGWRPRMDVLWYARSHTRQAA